MSYVDRDDSGQLKIGGIIAAAGGYALSRFLGPVGWIPMLLGFLSFVALTKTVRKPAGVCAVLAALISQTGWFLIGAIAVPSQASAVVPDIVVNSALMAWIFFRPGYWAAGAIVLVHLAGVVLNVVQLSAAGAGDERAFIAHIVLRAIIVAAAVMVIIYKANPGLAPEEGEEPDYAEQEATYL